MENIAQKNLVRRYLLGDLSEPDQLALEQEYFADSEKFEQVWAQENELVDGYVRGDLTPAERALFEQNYLTTPRHQQRVATAKSLLQAADALIPEEKKETVTDAQPATSWWTNLLALFQMPQMAWGAAAALLLLTLAGYWFFKNPNLPAEQIAKNVPDTPVATPTVTTMPSPGASASPLPTTIPKVEGKPTSPTPHISPNPQPAILSLALVGAGIRSNGSMQELTVPTGTKQVRLQVPLDGDDYAHYQVQLRTITGTEIVRQSALSPTPNKKSLAALIPAAKLSSGDYVVTLSGISQTGDVEEVNKFYFRINRK